LDQRHICGPSTESLLCGSYLYIDVFVELIVFLACNDFGVEIIHW